VATVEAGFGHCLVATGIPGSNAPTVKILSVCDYQLDSEDENDEGDDESETTTDEEALVNVANDTFHQASLPAEKETNLPEDIDSTVYVSFANNPSDFVVRKYNREKTDSFLLITLFSIFPKNAHRSTWIR
jgi:hypothetical protein